MRRRPRTRAVRPFDWAFPPVPARCEVLSMDPAEDAGRPPILFVHGLRHGAWCWQEHWMPELARRGWPVHAISLRGHAGSEGAERLRRTLLRDYVHDVMQAIVRLPTRPVLVGHSMGALVVQRVLERYPARAGVLVSPVPGHSGLRLAANYARTDPRGFAAVLAGRPLPLDRDDLFSADLDEATARRHLGRLGAESPLVQWELTLPRRMPRIEAPVQILATPRDTLIPVADVRRLAATLGTEPVWFPDMAHDLMLDARWREPLDAMATWLEDTLAGDRSRERAAA